jgi:hypothetical protein
MKRSGSGDLYQRISDEALRFIVYRLALRLEQLRGSESREAGYVAEQLEAALAERERRAI